MTTETITEPVNPLTGDLATITVRRRGIGDLEPISTDVQGRIIVPGLAITPSCYSKSASPGRNPRYSLTHVPTGLVIRPYLCGLHVQTAADASAASGLDWEQADSNAMADAIRQADLLDQLLAIGTCDERHCAGDGPEPPSWRLRCETCDWEYDPEDDYNEGPLTFDEAKRMGDDHECEPRIRLAAPDGSDWLPAQRFSPDGAVVPTSSTCRYCTQPVTNVHADFDRPLWQHDATRFVGCELGAPGRYAEPTLGGAA